MKKILSVKTFMIAFSFFAISAAAHAAKFDSYINITNNSSHDMKISDRWSDDKTGVTISNPTITPGETSTVNVKSKNSLKIHRFDLLVDWQNYRGNAVQDNLQLESSAKVFGIKPSVFPREGTTSFDKNYITGDIHVTEKNHRNSISFIIGDNNIAPVQYSLTSTVATGSGTVNPEGTTSLWSGDNQAITATPGTDYHLANWNVNGETVTATGNQYTVSNISANTTVKAYFEHNDITVTATAGEGGTISQAGKINLAYGKSLTLTATPNEGYELSGWTVDGVSQGNNTTLTLTDIEKDEVVTASFEKKELMVRVSATEGGSVDQSGDISVVYGKGLTLTATPNEGYNFSGWSVNGEDQGNNTTITLSNIEQNETVIANFIQLDFVVSVTSTEGGSVDQLGDISINFGDDLTLTAEPKNNYKLTEWLVNGENKGNTNTLALSDITNNTTVEAVFTLNLTSNIVLDSTVYSKINNVTDSDIDGDSLIIGNDNGIQTFKKENNEWDSKTNETMSFKSIPKTYSGLAVSDKIGGLFVRYDKLFIDYFYPNGQHMYTPIFNTDNALDTSAAMDGDEGIAGSPNTTVNGLEKAGIVYILNAQIKDAGWDSRYSGECSRTQLPAPSDIAANDLFGSSVSIKGDYAIVGAKGKQIGSLSNAGAAYIYQNINGTWQNTAELTSPENMANANFGSNVSIKGDYAIVSAPGAYGNSGAVYIFHKNKDGNWSDITKLKEHQDIYYFGSKAKIDGYNALVEGTKQDGTVVVYLYRRLNDNSWDDGIKLNTPSNGLAGGNCYKG